MAAKRHAGAGECVGAKVMAGGWLCGDGFARMWGAWCMPWGVRVSLSDWLALAGKNPGV